MTAPVSRRAWRYAAISEELHSNPPLFGVNAKDRALVEMWNRRIEFAVLQPIADAFRQRQPIFPKGAFAKSIVR